jgi:hypothetical protein
MQNSSDKVPDTPASNALSPEGNRRRKTEGSSLPRLGGLFSQTDSIGRACRTKVVFSSSEESQNS